MASLSQSFCVPEPRKFEKYETFIAKKPLRPLRQFQFDWFSRQKSYSWERINWSNHDSLSLQQMWQEKNNSSADVFETFLHLKNLIKYLTSAQLIISSPNTSTTQHRPLKHTSGESHVALQKFFRSRNSVFVSFSRYFFLT